MNNVSSSNSQKANVPKLRFPEFIDEWKQCLLENTVDIYDGTHQTPNYVNIGIPFVSVENIENLYKFNKFISVDDYKKEFKIHPEISDVLMTRIGDIGRTALVSKNVDMAYYVSLALLRCKRISPSYLKNYILSPYFQYQLWRRTLHMAVPKKINKGDIGKCIIHCPQTTEQDRISEFLSLIDQRIDKQSQLVETLKSYKRGVLTALFNKTSSNAKVLRLGDICKITTGKLDANSSIIGGKYPFFTCGKNTLSIDTYAFSGEALLIAGNGDIGNTKYYNGKFNAYQRTYVLMDFLENAKYVKYAIDLFLPEKIAEETQGGAMPYIKLSTLSNLRLSILPLNVQNQLCNILDYLENIINAESNLKIILEKQKLALLQQMFI